MAHRTGDDGRRADGNILPDADPPTLAPALAAERGWSDAVVGYLASLNTLGAILFLALGAPFLRRVGSVRAFAGGARGWNRRAHAAAATVRAGRRDGRLLIGWVMAPPRRRATMSCTEPRRRAGAP